MCGTARNNQPSSNITDSLREIKETLGKFLIPLKVAFYLENDQFFISLIYLNKTKTKANSHNYIPCWFRYHS